MDRFEEFEEAYFETVIPMLLLVLVFFGGIALFAQLFGNCLGQSDDYINDDIDNYEDNLFPNGD